MEDKCSCNCFKYKCISTENKCNSAAKPQIWILYLDNVFRCTARTVVAFSLGNLAIFPLIPLHLCSVFPYQNGILIPQDCAVLIYALWLILNYKKNEKQFSAMKNITFPKRQIQYIKDNFSKSCLENDHLCCKVIIIISRMSHFLLVNWGSFPPFT